MNHLEELVAEWLEYNGYFVRRNVFVGKRPNGGYDCELDVAAFHATLRRLVHVEPSLDAIAWDTTLPYDNHGLLAPWGDKTIPLIRPADPAGSRGSSENTPQFQRKLDQIWKCQSAKLRALIKTKPGKCGSRSLKNSLLLGFWIPMAGCRRWAGTNLANLRWKRGPEIGAHRSGDPTPASP